MTMYSLSIFIEDVDLYDVYNKATITHNKNISDDYFDSGFDIYTPETLISTSGRQIACVHNIVCKMTKNDMPCPFYIYPRSSIAKTPLRLANSVGIIDSGYRGSIISKFDNHNTVGTEPYRIEQYTRLMQICAPDLDRIAVSVHKVDNISELAATTTRGSGGFGSTGTS